MHMMIEKKYMIPGKTLDHGFRSRPLKDVRKEDLKDKKTVDFKLI